MRVPRIGVVLSCVAALAMLGACGDDDDDGGSAPAAATTTATASGDGAAAADTGGYKQETIDFGVEYTGGKAGKADASLPPVKIGFSTGLGGTPSFPENEAAADATVKIINEQLGGIDGHPVELVKCFIKSEEDGQKCGSEFLEAKVPIVNQSLTVIGNQSLYKTLLPKIPVLVGTTSTGPDSTTKGAYSFTGGGPAVIFAISADIARNIKGKYSALVSVGNPGGKFTMEQIAVPYLDKLKAGHGKIVYYADEATTPDIVSAVQAAGGSKADSIFFDPSGPQQCVSLYDAMKQLGITAPVVTTPICNADVFVDHAGGQPENWRIWGFGENPRVLDSEQVQVFVDIMKVAGQEKFTNVGFANSATRDLLTIAKFGNELGFDGITPDAMEKAMLAFPGPAFMVTGPQQCSAPLVKETPSICGTESVGSTVKDGKWQSLGAIKLET